MAHDPILAAVVSADDEVRAAFRDPDLAGKVDVVHELAIEIDDVSEGHVEEIAERGPDVVFLDLSEDPENGRRLTQILLEKGATQRVVGMGPMQEPEFLMQAMQAGVAEYLTKPVTPEHLRAAIERSRRTLVPREAGAPRRRAGRVYAFFSPKGGAGATTVATNLAIQLHRLTGRRTVLVDFDLELGGGALFLGIEPRYNVVDLAKNLHRVDTNLLTSYVARHDSGVHLLAGPYHPTLAGEVTTEQLGEILRLLRRHYDFVVVDCPKALSARTVRTFDSADEVYLVAQMDVPTIQNIQRAQPILDRIGNSGRALRLIVNRYDPAADLTLKDLEQSVGMEAFWTVANDYQAASYSANSGKPLIMRPGSTSAQELEALAAKIAGVEPSKGGSRGRLFGGILDRLRNRLTASENPTTEPFMLPPTAAEGESR